MEIMIGIFIIGFILFLLLNIGFKLFKLMFGIIFALIGIFLCSLGVIGIGLLIPILIIGGIIALCIIIIKGILT